MFVGLEDRGYTGKDKVDLVWKNTGEGLNKVSAFLGRYAVQIGS